MSKDTPPADNSDGNDGSIDQGTTNTEIRPTSITPQSLTVTGTHGIVKWISLIQNHLDQLDSLGVVAYDSRAKQVCPIDATDPIAQHIRKIMTACYTPEKVSE